MSKKMLSSIGVTPAQAGVHFSPRKRGETKRGVECSTFGFMYNNETGTPTESPVTKSDEALRLPRQQGSNFLARFM